MSLLSPTTPKNINNNIRSIFNFLDINEKDLLFIRYTKEKKFKAEVDNCHINNLVKQTLNGGKIIYGWRIWEDENNDFVEANFHSLWMSERGKLYDITPRKDGENTILFIPDYSRSVELLIYNNLPAIKTYDNFRLYKGTVQNSIKKQIIIVKTKLSDYLTKQINSN